MTSAAVAAEFRPPFLVQVRARDAALPRDGWVKCDQPMTLPVMLLGPKAGRLDPETLDRVDGALRFALGL
jgi:mRNA-degrading endonuclease toxin of MazEF toxin-antitoxin module